MKVVEIAMIKAIDEYKYQVLVREPNSPKGMLRNISIAKAKELGFSGAADHGMFVDAYMYSDYRTDDDFGPM